MRLMTVVHGYLGISNAPVDRTVEIGLNIDADVDAQGRVVGIETYGRLPDVVALIEVLQATRVPKGLKSKE